MFRNRWGVGALVLCAALSGCNLVVQTISEYGGEPIAGVQVQAGDQPWKLTDAEGQATFEPVGGSYTLRALQPSQLTTSLGGRYLTWDLLELDSPPGNPVVLEVEGSFVSHRSATLSGAVTGAQGSRIVLWLQGPGVVQGRTIAASNGTFQMPFVEWEGGDGRSATLHALQDDGAAFPHTRYLAHGSTPVVLTDPTGTGGTITDISVRLDPIQEATVQGEVAIPAALTGPAYGNLRINPGDGWVAMDRGPAPAPGPFTLSVPRLPGAASVAIDLDAFDSNDSQSGWSEQSLVVSPDRTARFDLPDLVELLEPAEGAQIGPSTVFRWSPHPSGGPYRLHVQCRWSESGEERDVNYRELETTLTERSIPAFPGVSIPAGAACTWDVSWSDAAPRSFSVLSPDRQGRWAVSRSRTATFQ